jgi:hypothetical protein
MKSVNLEDWNFISRGESSFGYLTQSESLEIDLEMTPFFYFLTSAVFPSVDVQKTLPDVSD